MGIGVVDGGRSVGDGGDTHVHLDDGQMTQLHPHTPEPANREQQLLICRH